MSVDKFVRKFTIVVWAALTCFGVLLVAAWLALEATAIMLGAWYK